MDIFHSFDNAFGGTDTTINGEHYQTQPNLYDGQDLYHNGQLVASSKPNIFGGVDIQDAQHQLTSSTQANLAGGDDVLHADGSLAGHIMTTASGQDFHGADGSLVMSTNQGNMSTIISMDDPLAHVNAAQLPTLIL